LLNRTLRNDEANYVAGPQANHAPPRPLPGKSGVHAGWQVMAEISID
jgi:hypothetical protein